MLEGTAQGQEHQDARTTGGPPWKITIMHDNDIFGKDRLVV